MQQVTMGSMYLDKPVACPHSSHRCRTEAVAYFCQSRLVQGQWNWPAILDRLRRRRHCLPGVLTPGRIEGEWLVTLPGSLRARLAARMANLNGWHDAMRLND